MACNVANLSCFSALLSPEVKQPDDLLSDQWHLVKLAELEGRTLYHASYCNIGSVVHHFCFSLAWSVGHVNALVE